MEGKGRPVETRGTGIDALDGYAFWIIPPLTSYCHVSFVHFYFILLCLGWFAMRLSVWVYECWSFDNFGDHPQGVEKSVT